jgi:hypothetical protein
VKFGAILEKQKEGGCYSSTDNRAEARSCFTGVAVAFSPFPAPGRPAACVAEPSCCWRASTLRPRPFKRNTVAAFPLSLSQRRRQSFARRRNSAPPHHHSPIARARSFALSLRSFLSCSRRLLRPESSSAPVAVAAVHHGRRTRATVSSPLPFTSA